MNILNRLFLAIVCVLATLHHSNAAPASQPAAEKIARRRVPYRPKVQMQRPFWQRNPLSRREVNRLVRRTLQSRREHAILEVLQKHFQLANQAFPMFSGVKAGYTVHEHTARVLHGLASEWPHLANRVASIQAGPDVDVFTTLVATIALHDSGKGFAYRETRQTRDQAQYNLQTLQPILQQAGFSPRENRLASALIANETIGTYARAKLSLRDAISQLKTSAEEAGVSVEDFYFLRRVIHASDLASYPVKRRENFVRADAGNLHLVNRRIEWLDRWLAGDKPVEGVASTSLKRPGTGTK